MLKLEKMCDMNLNKIEVFKNDLREMIIGENKFI